MLCHTVLLAGARERQLPPTARCRACRWRSLRPSSSCQRTVQVGLSAAKPTARAGGAATPQERVAPAAG